MKKIFRKNQLVITALALMIAVAGYFSYMNNNMDDGKLQTAAEAANAEVSAGELVSCSLIPVSPSMTTRITSLFQLMSKLLKLNIFNIS